MIKRIIALAMSVILVTTGLDTTAFAAQTTNKINESNVESGIGTPEVTGSNSVGMILANALSAEQAEQAEDNGNCIMSVEMTEKLATVRYVATEQATLVVAVYDNAGEKLLATGTKEVDMDARETTVTIDIDQMPEYYYVKAFLIESDTLKPLCSVYNNPNYTQEMQDFFAKTTDDFEEERVYNLDDDKTNNFLVYGEDVEQINAQNDVNKLVSADEENKVYVFENIDSSISTLSIGDIFTYGEENPYIIKVGGIDVDGPTATITGTETTMEDVFEFVKIDTSCDIVLPEEEDTEAQSHYGAANYGMLEYISEHNSTSGYVDGEYNAMGWGIEIDEGLQVTKDAISKEFGKKELPGGVELGGSFELTPGVGIKIYHDDYTYVEMTLNVEVALSISLSKEWSGEVPIADVPLAAVGVILVTLPVYFVIEVEGSVTFGATLSAEMGFSYHSEEGAKWIKPTPEVTIEAALEVSVFVGIRAAMQVSVLKIISIEYNVDVGAEIAASYSKEIFSNAEAEDEKHACKNCIDGDISAKLRMGWIFRVFGDEEDSDVLAEISIKVADFYYSFDNKKFGFGECPNLEYKTTIRFLNRDNKSVEGVLVNNTDISDEKGCVQYYLKPGMHRYEIQKEGFEDKEFTIWVLGAASLKTVYLERKSMEEDDYFGEDDDTENDPSGGEDGDGNEGDDNDGDDNTGDKEDDDDNVGQTEIVWSQLALGANTSAAIDQDGNLYMWGQNEYGKLGNGTTETSSSPIKVMENVTKVSLGSEHASALTKDGNLYTWGSNRFGQLGNGTTTQSLTPVKILEDVVDMEQGFYSGAAITGDGSLYMWGQNSYGQLGDGTTTNSLVPIKVLDNVIAVNIGWSHTGAIKSDGNLYMWGLNNYGQLGDGTTENKTQPTKILENVSAVSLTYGHSGAITKDGKLYMWGANYSCTIGDGTRTDRHSPVLVLENVEMLALGDDSHSAAITKDGKLYMWGYNSYGCLGESVEVGDKCKTPLLIMEDVKEVSLGDCHSGAIKKDGSLYMWGQNAYGQIGIGVDSYITQPMKLFDNVKEISLGSGYGGAITSDNTLYMWGDNDYKQLGDGTNEMRGGPVKILNDVVKFDVDVKHTGAITSDGSLYMWGANDKGQLGNNGDGLTQSLPTKVLDNVASVSIGFEHSAAITNDGTLYMWGDNEYGQLGDGTMEESTVPKKIMESVKCVSLGMIHSGAVTTNGDLYMWGWNGSYQLGNGTTVESSVPVKIMENVETICCGDYHSGALTTDGSLYMWGDESNGRLGDTSADRSIPTKILDDVISINMGDDCSGAIKADGSLYVWGAIREETMSIDGDSAITEPRKIMDNVQAFSLGDSHYGIIDNNNSFYIWGKNLYGQLGNGVFGHYPTPQKVSNVVDDDSPVVQSIFRINLSNALQSSSSVGTTDGNDGTGDGDDVGGGSAISPFSATFPGKIPGETYNFYVMKTRTGSGDATSDNILYLDQVVADVNGKVSVSYIPREDYEGAKIFLSGRLGKYDFANAVVAVKDQLYTGEELFADVTITYEGKELTEGIDYEIGGSYSATKPGEYTITVKGIGEYKGSKTATYHIRQFSLDVFGVIFDSKGGTAVETQEVESGQCATEPEAPVREYHHFKGWYLNGELYDFTTPVTAHLELVAQWEEFAQLDAPKANIPSGSRVNAGKEVALTTEMPEAAIHYTVDGTMPTTESPVYSTPIVIEQDVAIRAYAVMEGYYDSYVSVYEYTVIENGDAFDTVAPEDVPAEGIPEGIWVGKIADQIYTGKAIKPEIRVYDGTKRLVQGRDYTLSYKNNTIAQTDLTTKKVPTIVVKGKGNYSKTLTVPFVIQPLDLNAETITVDDVTVAYNEKVQKKNPFVYYGAKKLSKKDVEVLFVDTSEGAYKELGTYAVKLTGKGNFAGERMVNLTVTDKTLMSSVKVAKVEGQPYQDGTAIEPTLDVTYKKKSLTKGTDYDVSYLNNKEIGTATAILTGKGDYAGVKRVNFKITGTPMKKVKIEGIKNQTYTGDAITQELVLTHNGANLSKDAYTVEYINNTNVGTATVIITGKGAFSGTVKKKFKIMAYDLKEDNENVVDDVSQNFEVLYAKGGSKPSVDVVYKGTILTAGKDYTISYKNNNAVTNESTKKAPAFMIKGKGNFKGILTGTFRINTKALNDTAAPVTIVADDIAYNGKAGKYVSKPVLTDSNGKTLKAGVDYEKDIVYTLKDGTALDKSSVVDLEEEIVVTVTGKGNYTGTISTTYKVTELDFKKVKIKVSPQTYKGEAISLTKEDVEVTFGGVPLTFGEDYEIVEGSYKNNIRKGTASVTIKGKGSYGGSKSMKFKVVARELNK